MIYLINRQKRMTHFSKINNLKHHFKHSFNNCIGLKVWPLTIFDMFILYMKHLMIKTISHLNDWQKKFMCKSNHVDGACVLFE